MHNFTARSGKCTCTTVIVLLTTLWRHHCVKILRSTWRRAVHSGIKSVDPDNYGRGMNLVRGWEYCKVATELLWP